ncbi:alpha-N-acetylgalactosaminidase-like isoform X1 [Lineus longissimus]|uniref:alpha-N-acetylgalactosaminidase-like isoform X1 n=1 Tax=Lineus longissimus TaxID=88925 RepID=UPI00315CF42D
MSRVLSIIAALICLHVQVSFSLDNGLALTPPMGWLTWERFRCNTDCKNDPNNCISERLIKEMALHMKNNGYLAAGYEYITIDDCWPALERDPKTAKLVPDPERFPNGMKHLADYVHSLGMKFGIYEDFGTKTCGGYPGSEFYMQLDANTFAEWGVDLLKFDGCYSDPKQMDEGYAVMQFFLNQTGRPMVYSCEWPLYQQGSGMKPDYKSIAKYCNMWRNYGDIQDSWDSIESIIEYYGKNPANFSSYAGPGHFNDPDMLIVGDYGLSLTQQQSQMAMWAMMAAPLVMSVDLRAIPAESVAILQNKRVIAVNQDKLGVQGTRIQVSGNIQLWRKPIQPTGSFAFVILNKGTDGVPHLASYKVGTLVGNTLYKYNITETFSGKKLGTFTTSDSFQAYVYPTGSYMFTMEPVAKKPAGKDDTLRFQPLRSIVKGRD